MIQSILQAVVFATEPRWLSCLLCPHLNQEPTGLGFSLIKQTCPVRMANFLRYPGLCSRDAPATSQVQCLALLRSLIVDLWLLWMMEERVHTSCESPSSRFFQTDLLSNISDKSGCTPHIWIVALIPIDKCLSPSDSGNSSPATSEANVVFAVKKVGRVAGIQVHGLESVIWRKWCTGPFPQPAYICLASERAAVGDRLRGPSLEANRTVVEIDKELIRVWGKAAIGSFP